jgi:hypothetical protein
MANDLLDQVRNQARFVADHANTVTVDDGALRSLAEWLPVDGRGPKIDPSYYFSGNIDDTIAYVVTFTTMNFGSGWHPYLTKEAGRSGSITMMFRLRDWYRRHGPISAAELVDTTSHFMAEVFGQRLDPPVDELMSLFARALSDLGQLLISRFNGSFSDLVEHAGQSVSCLAETLATMPLYQDIAVYRGRKIPIMKRAQIASAELAAALGDHPLGHFADLDRLTAFADNLVPHVLRVEGVLCYDPELADRIDREELLAPGSAQEVEIRANTIVAVEELVAQIRSRCSGITAAEVGHLLWKMGQAPHYKSRPRHRCRTTFY